jgi:hypothetical protein
MPLMQFGANYAVLETGEQTAGLAAMWKPRIVTETKMSKSAVSALNVLHV